MKRKEVLEKVRELTAKALEIDPKRVTESSHLIDDLGAESIDLVDLTFRLEKTFSISVGDHELFERTSKQGGPMLTLGQVVDFVAEKTNNPHA